MWNIYYVVKVYLVLKTLSILFTASKLYSWKLFSYCLNFIPMSHKSNVYKIKNVMRSINFINWVILSQVNFKSSIYILFTNKLVATQKIFKTFKIKIIYQSKSTMERNLCQLQIKYYAWTLILVKSYLIN